MYAISDTYYRTRSGICEDDCDRDLPTKARRKFTRSHYLRVSWYVNLGQKWKYPTSIYFQMLKEKETQNGSSDKTNLLCFYRY